MTGSVPKPHHDAGWSDTFIEVQLSVFLIARLRHVSGADFMTSAFCRRGIEKIMCSHRVVVDQESKQVSQSRSCDLRKEGANECRVSRYHAILLQIL